jgi:hypothetical protein
MAKQNKLLNPHQNSTKHALPESLSYKLYSNA